MKEKKKNIRQRANRIILCPVFLCMLFFLNGCSLGKQKTYNGYYIYCLDANETKVEAEPCETYAKDGEPLIKELLSRMQKEPTDISFKKCIPDNVSVDDFSLDGKGNLSVYWNSAYGNYTGVSEILRRAAIVKTLCQIPDVSNVQFYVAGQPLTDSNLNAIGFMSADTFIDNTGEEAYTQTATLNMFFADYSGRELVEVPVKVKYDATIPLEQLALEQLMKGPGATKAENKEKLLSTVPKGVKINKISVKEHICYLDVSSDFMEKPDNISDDVAIYSVVNTLVDLSNINKVQFSIDGGQVLLYDDAINFGEPFERNLDIVKN